MTRKLLDTAMVAKRIGLHSDSVARLFRQGKIRGAFKAGGQWKVDEVDLARHIELQTPTPFVRK